MNQNLIHPHNHHNLYKTLAETPEGKLLLLGIALAFVNTLWLGVILVISPEKGQTIVGMVATLTLFGRAAGMAFGYSMALTHATVIPVSIIVETILVLIFYPLFVFSVRHLMIIKWLKKIFDKTQAAAELNKQLVQKYGIAGLLGFVWFPFWMTGPMVGCIIGYLLKMPIWMNMLAVLGGTHIAILCWALLLKGIHEKIASYSSYAAMAIMMLLIIAVATAQLLTKNHKKQ